MAEIDDHLKDMVLVHKEQFEKFRKAMLSDFESGRARDWKQIAETTGRSTVTTWVHKDQDEVEVRKGMVKLLECIETNMFWPGRNG